MLYQKMESFATPEQVNELNKLTGYTKTGYDLGEAYNLLPQDITVDEKRGYLQISTIDVSYTSLRDRNELVLCYAYNISGNTNIFNAIIQTIKWFKEYCYKITINDAKKPDWLI